MSLRRPFWSDICQFFYSIYVNIEALKFFCRLSSLNKTLLPIFTYVLYCSMIVSRIPDTQILLAFALVLCSVLDSQNPLLRKYRYFFFFHLIHSSQFIFFWKIIFCSNYLIVCGKDCYNFLNTASKIKCTYRKYCNLNIHDLNVRWLIFLR